MVDAALAALRRGWSVVPLHDVSGGVCSCGRVDCPSPGKHPRIAWEPAQVAVASVDQVRHWWGRWPEAGVGVVTGPVSGVVVLDVDPRNGGDESLARLQGRFGVLATTVETRTGGGGRHLWFRHPGGAVPSGPVAPGLDVKADGGLVVIPPTRHASGRRYEWSGGAGPGEVALAAPPSWLIDRARGGVRPRPEPTTEPPVRTAEEQRAFAAAWAELGLDLLPGDRMYRCPFHDDHEPSLHIDADGCRWFCFGCHEGGGMGRLRRRLDRPTEPRPRSRLVLPGAGGGATLPGGEEVDVVGESWHQDELLALTGGRRRYGGVDVAALAWLVPDPSNPADPDAVAVVIDDRVVGHLGRADARRLRPAIDRARADHGAATCRARIRGGWDRGRDDVGFFGVTLDVGTESD